MPAFYGNRIPYTGYKTGDIFCFLVQNREVFTAEFYAVNGISDDSLLKNILEFVPFNEQEVVDKQTMLDFIETFDDVLTRKNVFGHFTASAYVINEDWQGWKYVLFEDGTEGYIKDIDVVE